MEAIILGFLAVMAVALAVAVSVAISRGRALDAARNTLRSALREVDRGGVGDDLTDDIGRLRRRAETAEFALDQRLRDLAYLADLVGVGIVRLTDDLRIEVANTAAHVFLDRPAGSMVGRTAIEGLGDHRIEAVATQARDSGSAAAEVAFTDPDGPTLIARARRSPILGVWLVLQDVAELRRLQRIRAEFVDNVSHELRTPITTIGLLAESLARDATQAGDAVPPRMRERIGKLEDEIANIAQMSTELLDLARIEGGGPQLLLDDVDLGRVVSESAERLRPFAERQGIPVEVAVAPKLPPVRGEAGRLGQVFTNLLHNAIKFSAAGSTVEAGARMDGPTVVAWVTDHGIGIDPLDQPRIFERFYKADRTRTRGGGTGIGLAIVRHVVEGHRGTVEVASVPGEGSTFTIRLPAADVPAAAAGPAAAAAAGAIPAAGTTPAPIA